MGNSTRRTYPVHPAANLFPMMDEESYQRLKEDIRVNGLQESVTLWRGQLVDGRNRQRACDELGIDEDPNELDDNADPVAFVLSMNLCRRHLRTSQRSLIAARLATLSIGANQHGGKEGGQNCPPSTKEAAKALGVSPSSVKSAKTVLSVKCDELVWLVETDRLSVAVAADFAKCKMAAFDRRTLCMLPDAPTRIHWEVNERKYRRSVANKPPTPRPEPTPPSPPPVPVCPKCGGDEVDDADGSHCPKCSVEMIDANDPPTTPISHTIIETDTEVVYVPASRPDDDAPEVDAPARHDGPAKGIQIANEAINLLKRVFPSDKFYRRAFEIVHDYCEARLSEGQGR